MARCVAFKCKGCSKAFTKDTGRYCHVVGDCPNKQCPAENCNQHAEFRANPRQHMKQQHNVHGCASCCSRFFLAGAAEAHASMATHPPNVGTDYVKYTGFDQPDNIPISAAQRQHDRDNALCLTPEEKKRLGDLTNRLKDTLEKSGIDVANVYRSGSTKNGTAVRGVSDIDIIAYCNTNQSAADFARTTKKQYLDQIVRMVKEKSGFGWANNVTCVRQTNFHDELRIGYKGRSYKVDLLIATKSPLSDPNNKPALLAMWKEMKGQRKKVRQHRSAEFAPAQAELIGSLPPKTKTVIREMKDWIEKNSVPLKSSPLYAVVIRNWEALGELHKFRRSDLKRMVLEDLAHLDTMRETWPDRYDARRYQDAPFPDGPVLLDPLNPFNNLAPTDPKEVKEIMDKARASLGLAS